MDTKTSEKLRCLFRNPDAVLQRAGFYKSQGERLDMPGCFVGRFEAYYEAEGALDKFMEADRTAGDVLEFLGVEDNGSLGLSPPRKA